MTEPLAQQPFSLYFGDASDQILHLGTGFDQRAVDRLRARLGLSSLTMPLQVHGTIVHTVTAEQPPSLFTRIGDALITNTAGCAIGILTADCVPTVLVDPKHKAIAVVHAGWRGLQANIFDQVLAKMQATYQSEPKDILVFFGPHAKPCCYRVDKPFLDQFNLPEAVHRDADGYYYFDLGFLARSMLINLGVNPTNIDGSHSVCTICNQKYFSFRRQGAQAGRQATIAWLKP